MGLRASQGFLGTIGQPTAQVVAGSLKFDASASTYLTRTPGSAGDRKIYTISFWVKSSNHDDGASQGFGGGQIFSSGTTGAGARTSIGFPGSSGGSNQNKFAVAHNATGSSWASLFSDTLFRDFSAWQNFVVSVNCKLSEADRVKVFCNGERILMSGTMPGNEDQPINNTIGHAIGRYNPESKDYFNGFISNFYLIDGYALGPEQFGFTDPLTNTWRPKAYNTNLGTKVNGGIVWSDSWDGTGSTGTVDNPARAFNGDLTNYTSNQNSGTICNWVPSSPIPIKRSLRVYAGAISSGNNQVFVNGTSLGNIPSGPEWYSIQATELTSVGLQDIGSTHGYLYAVEVDGVILVDSSTSNSTDATYPFGTNGFYLPMDSQDDFEKDKTGNGNHFTKSGFSGTSSDPDVLKDSPSGVAFGGPPTVGLGTTNSAPSNYATLNPVVGFAAPVVLSNGNLDVSTSGLSESWRGAVTTIAQKSGKYYAEFNITAKHASNHINVGINPLNRQTTALQSDSTSGHYYNSEGKFWNANSYGGSYASYDAGDVIGVAVDMETNNDVKFYKNGSLQGTVSLNSNITTHGFQFAVAPYAQGSDTVTSLKCNFGQKPFKYAPPDGFVPLTSASVTPEIVITDPTQYVGVTTYDGNGGTRAFDLGMSPDFVWVKRRDDTFDNMLFDTVRGNGKELYSERNYAEGSPATSKLDFIPNGFNLPSTGVNVSSANYVAWFWKAGGKGSNFNIDDVGYSSASDAGLDGGTINPTKASVGTKQGFSILTWSSGGSNGNYTISHGLGKKPRFIIQKALDESNWWVYHADAVGETYTKHLQLNSNSGVQTNSANFWGASGHTDSLYGVRVGDLIGSSHDAITYLWADVPGLQKFGSYTCNGDGSGGGDEDGPYVELGFRPALILFKGSSYTSDWAWIDEARCKLNYNDVALRANYQYSEIGNARGGVGSSSQPANYAVDFLSNGFKIRASAGSLNYQTNTVTYAAWAKSPFSNLFGGQSNAK